MCCRLHPHTLQCLLPIPQWYKSKIFISAQICHIALQAWSLGNGFLQPVMKEPLLKQMHPVCRRSRSRAGTDNIHCLVEYVKQFHFRKLYIPKPLASSESDRLSKVSSTELSMHHLTHTHPALYTFCLKVLCTL